MSGYLTPKGNPTLTGWLDTESPKALLAWTHHGATMKLIANERVYVMFSYSRTCIDGTSYDNKLFLLRQCAYCTK